MENQSMVVSQGDAGKLELVKSQIALVGMLYRDILKKDIHYGVIPGTIKPTLYKAGAEKIVFMFHLVPEFEIKEMILPNGHKDISIKCVLRTRAADKIGEGVGSASSMESKYRYRNIAAFEEQPDEIPKDYKDKKSEYRKQGFGCQKIGGIWKWVKYAEETERKENPDIADTWNTVLKIAKKRAFVDTVLTVAGVSDVFTQDVEEFADIAISHEEADKPAIVSIDEKRKVSFALCTMEERLGVLRENKIEIADNAAENTQKTAWVKLPESILDKISDMYSKRTTLK